MDAAADTVAELQQQFRQAQEAHHAYEDIKTQIHISELCRQTQPLHQGKVLQAAGTCQPCGEHTGLQHCPCTALAPQALGDLSSGLHCGILVARAVTHWGVRVRKPGIGISEVQLIQVAGNRRWWLTTSVTQSLVLNRYRHPKSSIAHGEPMNEAVPNTPWTVDRLQYTFSNGIRLIRLSMAMICPVEHVRRLHPTRTSSAHSMSDFQTLVKVVGSTGPRIAALEALHAWCPWATCHDAAHMCFEDSK